MEQMFSYSSTQRQVNFTGSFTIPASTIKWTILFNSSLPFTSGLQVPYELGGVLASNISRQTIGNSTTYYIPLQGSSNLYTSLEVFDLALVDGIYRPISHSIRASSDSMATLILEFPPFASSIYYDPILGLGILLGNKPSSDDETGLIVGVVVGVTAAVMLVITVIVIVVLVGVIRSKRHRRSSAVNFDGREHTEQESQLL